MQGAKKKVRSVSYAKWGYVFIAPFFIVFALFQLYPLVSTIYYSFFEYFFKQGGLIQVGPKFVGWTNYLYVFSKDLPRYFGNTIIMWLMGFIPQIVFSLLLAAWFTDNRLKLKCQGFFKTVIYMPNLIMASAFAMLFFALFANQGPVNNMIQALGGEPIRFLSNIWGTRSLVALMNFLMWFGNTTIILMAAMMGISPSMFEAAQIDGATPNQTFWKITLPLIRPILVYTLVTSLIGGLQMFDVPQILTNGKGDPVRSSMTVVMYLNNFIGTSKNYGRAGAVSAIMFVICAVLCVVIMRTTRGDDERKPKPVKAAKAVKGGKAA